MMRRTMVRTRHRSGVSFSRGGPGRTPGPGPRWGALRERSAATASCEPNSQVRQIRCQAP